MPKRARSGQPGLPVHTVDMAKLATLHGLGEEVYEVAAIMFHPRDAAARRTFVASAVVDMMERLADLTSPRGRVVVEGKPRDVDILSVNRLLDEAIPSRLHLKGSKGEDESGYAGVFIAAEILARAFKLADDGWPESGIAQVINEQGEEYKREGVVGAGRDNLTDIWQEHRASAHIALAFLEKKRRLTEERRDFFDWVGRSMDLFKQGASIGSRFGTSILPPEECWKIVLFPTAGE